MRMFLRPFALILPLALAGAQAGSNRPFPMAPYAALGAPWLAATDDEPLFAPPFQARKAAEFQENYLGPWSPGFIAGRLTPQVAGMEAEMLAELEQGIQAQSGFGPGIRPYGPAWLDRIKGQLPAAPAAFRYQAAHRAVTLENALVRLLPTMDLYMLHPDLPGQGYPFDRLQNSVLWAGTPVYLLARSRDRRWCKVLTADCAGWIRARSLALAGGRFVRRWRRAVRRHGLVAAVATGTPVLDAGGRVRCRAYVGSVFPGRPGRGPRPAILIPGRAPGTHQAFCRQAFLAPGAGVPQPWPYTARHAAVLLRTLLGRPYGWGNARYHNDCSAELKHFFTPFGRWLPRHSSDQRDAGRAQDLSALDLQARLAELSRIGRPYRSLLWIEGHVMLYLGGLEGSSGFMTYQNLWGLRPKELPDYRAVIGGSVLFPVLERYPEDPGLQSLADKSRLVVTSLDEDP